jgi:hypothetical protein
MALDTTIRRAFESARMCRHCGAVAALGALLAQAERQALDVGERALGGDRLPAAGHLAHELRALAVLVDGLEEDADERRGHVGLHARRRGAAT